MTLGDSDALVVGQYVMALGSPLALQRSLSFGVVSSKDRYLSDEFKLPTGEKTGSFNTWIQTDAAINPGNSGGPLVNLAGEVVGVNARGAFGASSIGFAIPINIVKEVARGLIEKGQVSRSWLGLTFQPLEELAQYFEAERPPRRRHPERGPRLSRGTGRSAGGRRSPFLRRRARLGAVHRGAPRDL